MARTRREKRMLYALGATVAVVAVVVLVTLSLAGGSESKREGAPPRAAVTRPAKPALAPAPQPEATRPVSPLVFHGVDPFRPLVNSKPAGSKKAPAPPPPPENPPGPASAVVGGKTVTLLDVFEKNGKKRAHVDVDDTVYSAAAGANFVDDYVLVSFSDPCVQFAWRDQSFRLCVQPGVGA